MLRKSQPNIVVVKKETRLEGLKARWVSPSLAKFRIQQAHAIEAERRVGRARSPAGAVAAEPVAEVAHAMAGFGEYESEDKVYTECLQRIREDLQLGLPIKMLDRALLPTFDFWNTALVVVVGPDGLVANTAKYVGATPLIGVNPDPRRIDGVLLPFEPQQVRPAAQRVLNNRHVMRSVTLAEVRLSDGQRMLAFNDFFVGCATHVSARYTLEFKGRTEPQSSSGVLVSTGAGATGWMSSVFNMASGISRFANGSPAKAPAVRWEDRRLLWAVREPFRSKQSGADLVAGALDTGEELVVESLMPKNGVIFSDGIENDFIEFNSGAIARITVAEQSANLVVSDRKG